MQLKEINAYPQPYMYTQPETSYQSPEMLTWQTSCTRKEVLRKMNLKLILDKSNLDCVCHLRFKKTSSLKPSLKK